MGLLDIFKKKKPPEPAAPEYGMPAAAMPMPGEIPIDQVFTLKQQGLTNNQIIQTLQRQGYQPQQIYDALAQAEARGGVEPYAPPSPEAPSVAPPPVAVSPAEVPKGFEEIAESIVEEKWGEFSRELGKVNEWKDTVSGRIDKLEQSMTDFKADLNNLHKAIVSKISDYDRSLQDVGVEIKAMEKVFQRVLPELTGSVAELSRITRTVKGKPFAEKKPSKKK